MPHILIVHTLLVTAVNNASDGVFIPSLKRNIRSVASQELSIEGRQLQAADFSFKFLPAGEHDELLHDLDIIILAHADDDRLKRDLDEVAQNIGAMVAVTIEAAENYTGEKITFSVAPFYGYMGYYTSSATPRRRQLLG